MKNIKIKDLNGSFSDPKQCWQIIAKLLETNEKLTKEKVTFVK